PAGPKQDPGPCRMGLEAVGRSHFCESVQLGHRRQDTFAGNLGGDRDRRHFWDRDRVRKTFIAWALSDPVYFAGNKPGTPRRMSSKAKPRASLSAGAISLPLLYGVRVFILLAMVSSGYLTWVSWSEGHALGCGPDLGCERVLQSRWA